MAVDRANSLGVYISFPFCRSKCTYCNFASGVYPASKHTEYIDRLIKDLAAAGDWAARTGVELPHRVDTIYMGGGTPSLLAPELVDRLFTRLASEFDVDRDAEITVECAPGQLSDESLQAFARVGVNRISLGVQSFIDSEAHASGRLHNRAVVTNDLSRLRATGITNLNVDLIAGLAGQTFDSWRQSLDLLIESGVPHASVYMLEVDEDSRLGREMLAGGARYRAELVPSDEAIATMYDSAIELLAAAGVKQYEISNFARPGHESRHNLRYWQRRPYLGLGLDASSMLRSTPFEKDPSEPRFVLRSTTTDDLAGFLSSSLQSETAWLSPLSQHEEAWFLGLRLNSGVDAAELEREFGDAMVAPALEVVSRLVKTGSLRRKGSKVCLTERGRLLSNDVFQEFLGLEPAPRLARA